MTERGKGIAARARSLVGVRFRPQGRDPELGLDCVGLAAVAADLPVNRVRRDYALRGQRLAEIEHELSDLGLQPVCGREAEAGDVLVFGAGPAQLHMGILTEQGFVHADAGLRMVVERPLPLPWPVLGLWRVAGAS
jgi:cell wall-associated NlpC family hydrolase